VIWAPHIPEALSYVSHSLNRRFSLRHFFLALSLMFGHARSSSTAGAADLRLGRIVRRLLLREKWTILWARDGRYAISFTNRFFAVAALVVTLYDALAWRSPPSQLLLVAVMLTGSVFRSPDAAMGIWLRLSRSSLRRSRRRECSHRPCADASSQSSSA
jgi:hypothetical protein